jgi:ribosomal protein S18 acetylase RimI-like enzyme
VNYTYEKITLNDIDFIHDLFSFQDYHPIFYENNTSKDDWVSRFVHISNFEIIYDSNTKIGVMNIDEKDTIEILLVALRHDLRGMGIGTKIFDDIFKKYGLNIYKVTVKETNEKAIKFYKKLGFEIDGKEIQDLGDNGKHIYLNLTFRQ